MKEALVTQLNALAAKYAEGGIRFFLIDPSSQDSRKKVAEEVATYGIKIPVLVDETQEVSKTLGIDGGEFKTGTASASGGGF